MKKKTLNTEYSADLSPNFGGASVMYSRYLGEWGSEADDYMFCFVEGGDRKIGVCPVDFLDDDEVCNLMIEHSVGAVVFQGMVQDMGNNLRGFVPIIRSLFAVGEAESYPLMLVGKGIWEQFIAEGMVDAAKREKSSKFVNVIFIPQKIQPTSIPI